MGTALLIIFGVYLVITVPGSMYTKHQEKIRLDTECRQYLESLQKQKDESKYANVHERVCNERLQNKKK